MTMELLINWIVALCVVFLFFVGLYVVVKSAVRSGMKEAVRELGREVAKKVWEEDNKA